MSDAADQEAYYKNLTQNLLSIPIHRTLGLSLISQTPIPVPTALAEFTTQSMHLTHTQRLHGGIAYLFIDVICFLALAPTLSVGERATTVASSFQFLNNIPGVGKRYEVEGKVLKKGRAIAYCEGEVRCEGKVIGKGRITKAVTWTTPERRKGKL
jgi:acyl-coenzyme A thioesterase PaaI-like protein